MIGYIFSIALIVILGTLSVYYYRRSHFLSKRITRVMEDYQEMVRFLHRFSHDMVKSRDERQWLQAMADYLADAVRAEVIRIFLLEHQSHINLVAHSGIFPANDDGGKNFPSAAKDILDVLHREQFDMGEGIIGKVASSGQAIQKEVSSSFIGSGQKMPIESFLAIPMNIEKRNNGVICAINKRERGTDFSEDDRLLLSSLASPIALAGSLFQIYADLNEQQRIHQELRLAREIQNSLLPREAPKSEWFSVYGVHKAATEVSGDFYDFVEIDDNFLLVIIADASGKGVPACMITAMCRTFIRANAARYKENLEGLLKDLNRSLFRDTDEAKFVTLACCLIDKRDSTVEYARAGHTEMLFRQPTGSVQIVSPDGPALGLFPPGSEELEFDTFAFSWLPNTSIMLFTDGLTEALNENQEEFGLNRLVSTFGKKSSDPITAAGSVLSAVKEFTQHQPQTDDETIVILMRNDVEFSSSN